MKIFSKLLVSAGVVTVLAGCGQTTTPVNTNSTTTNSTAPSSNVNAVTLGEYAFAPQSLTLTQGQSTTISVTNQGNISHTYTVNELGINLEIAPGQTKTQTLTPNQPGTFTVMCTVAGHQALGMEGTITVK